MKIYPFKIPKPESQNLIVQEDKGKIFYNQLHQHEEIQISLIVKGRGKLVVADSVHHFTEGDVFVIGKNSPHLFQSVGEPGTKSHMISLFFTETSFGNHFFEMPELNLLRGFFGKADAGFKILSHNHRVEELIGNLPIETKFMQFVHFLFLLETLCHAETQVLSSFVYSKNISGDEGQRMQRVMDYVMNNFQDQISLENVAAMAYMTPNAFCRFFKLRTNKTFFEFLIELRIEHSCHLILNHNDMSIAEIAEISGFKSISNFNRKFKRLKGKTPRQYNLA